MTRHKINIAIMKKTWNMVRNLSTRFVLSPICILIPNANIFGVSPYLQGDNQNSRETSLRISSSPCPNRTEDDMSCKGNMIIINHHTTEKKASLHTYRDI